MPLNTQSLALSMNFVDYQSSSFLKLPKKVENQLDIYRKSTSKRRSLPADLSSMYNFARETVCNFEDETHEWVEDLNREDLREKSIGEILDEAFDNHRMTEDLLEVQKTLMENREASPDIYFMARKHYVLAKVLLKFLEERKDEISLDEAFEKIKENEYGLEAFKLGVFVGMEPILVSSLILASLTGDEEYINQYSRILDKVSFIFSRNFEEEIREEIDVPKKDFSSEEKKRIIRTKGFQVA